MSIRPKRSLLNPALERPSALNSRPRDPNRLWLDKNENLDPELMAVTARVLASIPGTSLASYPEAGELYRKLARWVGVSADSLLLTPGSDGAIRLTFETFVEHGDNVIHTAPTFAMYPIYSQMFGAAVCSTEYVRTENGPQLNAKEIIDTILKKRPKLFCLPNPDSPTGTVLAPEILAGILAACEDTDTVFLLDEAYHPFYDWSAASWTAKSRNLVVARTFAKAWGAAGLRIGYAVAHPETIILLHKMRPMYEVSTIAVEFMSRMLDHADEMSRSVARLQNGKRFFEHEMQTLGFAVLPTKGNFTHVAFAEHGKYVHQALADRVLYRASFDHPSLSGYSRFSIAPEPQMAKVVEFIKTTVERNS